MKKIIQIFTKIMRSLFSLLTHFDLLEAKYPIPKSYFFFLSSKKFHIYTII